jgi:hypothetical protein
MSDFEPAMKDAVARVYAKRYTLAELTDIATFFRSASGKAFAEGMMPMMSDPDYVNAMSGIGPKLMQAMPDIMEKVKKATAKLPPPPKDEAKPRPAEVPTT